MGVPLFRMTTAHRRIEQLIAGALSGSFIRAVILTVRIFSVP